MWKDFTGTELFTFLIVIFGLLWLFMVDFSCLSGRYAMRVERK